MGMGVLAVTRGQCKQNKRCKTATLCIVKDFKEANKRCTKGAYAMQAKDCNDLVALRALRAKKHREAKQHHY